MPAHPTRRQVLKSAAAAAVVAAAKPSGAPAQTAPARKLRIALIGVGGRGWDHVREVAAIEQAEIVALCDVDSARLETASKHVPAAAAYADFREALKRPDVEAVLVATPDHTHAVITAAALHSGRHVYCEKPLTHTVREARQITELARDSGKVTQLGIQIHALDNYRRVVELIRAGAIGQVREVHIWNHRTNRPAVSPAATAPAEPPPTLNYDLWLGPVPYRPFNESYHPYNWRRYWAFGTGLLGDIACHLMDVAFWALDLPAPTRIETTGAPLDDEITCEWTIARYDFPARGDKPAVKLTWYDPPKQPEALSSWNLPPDLANEGVMFIGEGGRMLYTNYTRHMLLPESRFKSYAAPAPTIPSSPGHQRQWIEACLKNDPAAAETPFSYGGLLTETALLGAVAFRAQSPIEWDPAAGRITNAPDAERFLSYPYRDGWSLE